MIYIIKIQSVRQEDRGVKCPFCNEADTKVIDSRPADDNSSIRRRRQCEQCGKRFTTYEKLETMPLMVIKKDRSREVYDRSKIESGILHSCHKRPVSSRQIDSMVDEVELQVFNREEKEVESTVIGELVMKKLQEVDEVAYVRFASVYREFKDVNTFIEEIGKLLKK
jgi:transcriptional repressor NrdR